MNILLVLPVNNLLSNNGESIHIYNLCKSWAASGHLVHIITLKSKQHEKLFEKKDHISIHRLPFTISPLNQITSKSLKSIINLPVILITSLFLSLSLLLRNNFDLIFVRYRPPFSSISLLLNYLTSKPMIIKFAGIAVYSYLNLPLEKKIFKMFIRRSKFLISDNLHMNKIFENKVPKFKLRNIQPPVCLNSFSTQLLNNEKKLSKAFIVLYVSSFKKDEDVTKFVLAASTVSKIFPEISFKIVGDGVTKPLVVKLSKQLGLENVLTFLGPVSHKEVPTLIEDSDLLVALYVETCKAIPIKILEYGAARKPVITSSNIVDVFKNDVKNFKAEDNFYVVNSTVSSLVDAIITLYKNAEKRHFLSENIYKTVAENFSLDYISNKYVELFSEAIKK